MIEEILKSLRSRKAGTPGSRIGSMSRYLSALAKSIGTGKLAGGAQVTESEIRAVIKSKTGILTWFDTDNSEPACRYTPTKSGKDGATVTVTGTPLVKEQGDHQLSSGSLMDFDCVITTRRRDRDGDVLDPKGAIVDPKMPLLWQHVPFQPIGRMVRLLEQTDDKVTGRFMIANTQLGQDAATLIDAGCLRISHGFAPIEFNPLKDDNGKDMGGWAINKYAMMETSAVSIPSNVDAEITQFSRGKLHHPLVKSWCAALNEARPKLVKGGWDPTKADITLTINLKSLLGDKADDQYGGDPEEDEDEKISTEDGTEEGKEEDDEDDSELEEQADGSADEGDGTEEEGDGTEDEGDGTEEEGDGGAKQGRALGEIIDSVKELAGTADLPKEAAGRLQIIQGMFEDIEAGIGASADAIGNAAKGRDLAGIFTAVADLAKTCTTYLQRASDELQRVGSVPDLPDAVGSKLGEIGEDVSGIIAGVAALSGATASAGDAGGEVELEEAGEDEYAEDDANEDSSGDDEDDELEDMEGAAADDEDDDESMEDGAGEGKGQDDEDTPRDENPESDVAGGSNPGVEDGKRGITGMRLSRILGRRLCGLPTTKREREILRRHGYDHE